MENLISSNKFTPQLKEEFAYESIKEAIISGDLKPNQQISLSSLAKNLGVSIIPVNTAIRRLISEGLVTQESHHSPYVAEFSAEDLDEVLTIRYHLEELALRKSLPNIGEKEIRELRAMKADMDEKVQARDTHSYGIANRQFHMKMYSYCQYQLLCELIDDLWNKAELNRSRSVFSLVQNMAEHSQGDHERILDLIEQHRIDDTIEAMRDHREYSRKKLLEIIK